MNEKQFNDFQEALKHATARMYVGVTMLTGIIRFQGVNAVLF